MLYSISECTAEEGNHVASGEEYFKEILMKAKIQWYGLLL
jgi:hypothetical protein